MGFFGPSQDQNSVPPWFHKLNLFTTQHTFCCVWPGRILLTLQSHSHTSRHSRSFTATESPSCPLVVSKERSYHRLSRYALFVVFSPTLSQMTMIATLPRPLRPLERSVSRTLYLFGTSSDTKDFSCWATCRASSAGAQRKSLIGILSRNWHPARSVISVKILLNTSSRSLGKVYALGSYSSSCAVLTSSKSFVRPCSLTSDLAHQIPPKRSRSKDSKIVSTCTTVCMRRTGSIPRYLRTTGRPQTTRRYPAVVDPMETVPSM